MRLRYVVRKLTGWYRGLGPDPGPQVYDAKEMRHNDTVYSYQGNRNPFVDHPEWVSGVFLGYISGVEDEAPAASARIARIASIAPNPFNPRTEIRLEMAQAGRVAHQARGLQEIRLGYALAVDTGVDLQVDAQGTVG